MNDVEFWHFKNTMSEVVVISSIIPNEYGSVIPGGQNIFIKCA